MNTLRILSLAIVLTLLTTLSATAAPSKNSKAYKILTNMDSFYKKLESASLTASFKHPDRKQADIVKLAMKRPNYFSLKTKSNEWGQATSNGKMLVCSSPTANFYTTRKSPTKMMDIFKSLDFGAGVILCANWSIDTLLAGQTPHYLKDNGPKIKYLGIERANKQDCHHILIDESSAMAKTREFWISTSKEPWLVKERYAGIKVVYSNQIKNPQLASSVFNYTPPKSAKLLPVEKLHLETAKALIKKR